MHTVLAPVELTWLSDRRWNGRLCALPNYVVGRWKRQLSRKTYPTNYNWRLHCLLFAVSYQMVERLPEKDLTAFSSYTKVSQNTKQSYSRRPIAIGHSGVSRGFDSRYGLLITLPAWRTGKRISVPVRCCVESWDRDGWVTYPLSNITCFGCIISDHQLTSRVSGY